MTDNTIFIHYLTISTALGYFLVFLGMIIEGDAVLFTSAFLIHQGNFDLGNTLFLVFSGALIGDMLWYYFGFKLNHSQKFFFIRNWMDRISNPFDIQLRKRPFKTILISKFFYGMHHAILMRAGSLKFPIKKFLKIDATAIMFWIALVGGLGYLSGASFSFLKRFFKFAEIMLAAGLFIFILLIHFVRPWMTKSLSNDSNRSLLKDLKYKGANKNGGVD